jgi:pyrroloquinoline quinone biosynthesis protein B
MTRLSKLAALAVLALPVMAAAQVPSRVSAVVLGIAQDGGVPHLGCRQRLCVEARRDPSKRRRVAALGLVDTIAGKRFVIDATPDFAEQVARLGGLPDGILLTHAHIGHYLGLAQLGREVVNVREMPVYCTPSMARFLRENGPWKRLVTLGNIAIHEIEPDREFALTDSLRITALRVPHRDEDSDTVAYLVAGPSRKLLWLPDIDKWETWDRRIEDVIRDADIAFLDGTFSSAEEIPGRSLSEIPHPLVPETVARLSKASALPHKVFFCSPEHQPPPLGRGGGAAASEEGIRSRFGGPARSPLTGNPQYTPPVRWTIAVQRPLLKRNVARGTRTAAEHHTIRLVFSDQSGPKPAPIMRTNAVTSVLMSSEPTHCPCSRKKDTPQHPHCMFMTKKFLNSPLPQTWHRASSPGR